MRHQATKSLKASCHDWRNLIVTTSYSHLMAGNIPHCVCLSELTYSQTPSFLKVTEQAMQFLRVIRASRG